MWIVSKQSPDGRRPLVVYRFAELCKAEAFLDMMDPDATGLFQIKIEDTPVGGVPRFPGGVSATSPGAGILTRNIPESHKPGERR